MTTNLYLKNLSVKRFGIFWGKVLNCVKNKILVLKMNENIFYTFVIIIL